MEETITTTDLLKNTFEPRRKFRYIFRHERIDSYLVQSVDLQSRYSVSVKFYDTEENRVFEQLLLDMMDDHTSMGSYTTLGREGAVLSKVDLGPLKVLSVKPSDLDYTDDGPVIFEALLGRMDA